MVYLILILAGGDMVLNVLDSQFVEVEWRESIVRSAGGTSGIAKLSSQRDWSKWNQTRLHCQRETQRTSVR